MKRLGASALIAGSLVFIAAAMSERGRHAGVTEARPNSNEFVVSSPGDAGPGTLRDAILAADRLSERAHIVITVGRITIESALPALVNPHGVIMEAAPHSGVIDATHQSKGAVLQINSPSSTIRGLSIENARDIGIVVSSPADELDTLVISNSKVGVVLGSAAKGCVIRKASFEHDETAITAEMGIRDVAVIDSLFRGNSRAGFWFVGTADGGAAVKSTGSGEQPAPREAVRLTGNTFEANTNGVVIANRPTLVQKNRFMANRESAILILGGEARVQDNEISTSGGTAVSVADGNPVWLVHNTLTDNPATAIMVRDSQATIGGNKIQGNGFGIVSISSGSSDTLIQDNWIAKNAVDAITVIGGSPQIQRNQVLANGGAGIRILDLVTSQGSFRAAPRLEVNVVKDNGVDMPARGIYQLASAPAR